MIERARKIHKRIHELAQDVPENPTAENFALDVMQKSDDIMKWVDDKNTVTEGQITALENMERGLGKWVRN